MNAEWLDAITGLASTEVAWKALIALAVALAVCVALYAVWKLTGVFGALAERMQHKLNPQRGRTGKKDEGGQGDTGKFDWRVGAVRMALPVGFVLLAIALGWNNLTTFARETMGAPAWLSPAAVALFSGAALWAAWERYRLSRENEDASGWTVLLWFVIAAEAGAHMGSAWGDNTDAHGLGGIYLAALPVFAGVLIEFALNGNKGDSRREADRRAEREIPPSFRRHPATYLKVRRVLDAYPDWTFQDAINHIRSNRAAAAAHRLAPLLEEESRFKRMLLGEGRARASMRRAMVELNPHGRPDADPRRAFADMASVYMGVDRVALAANSEESGSREAVLRALGLNTDQPEQEQSAGAPESVHVDTSEGVQQDSEHPAGVHPESVQQSAPEGVQSGTEHPESEHPEGVHVDTSEGVQQDSEHPGTEHPESVQLEGVQLDDDALREALEHWATEQTEHLPAEHPESVQQSAPEGVQSGTEHPESEHPEGVHVDTSEGVQQGDEKEGVNTSKGRRAKASKGRRAKASKGAGADPDKQVEEVVKMLRTARDGDGPEPSGRQVARHLGTSPATGMKRLAEAKAMLDSEGQDAAK